MKIINSSASPYTLDIVPNTVNYIVGLNGTGKTVALSSLVSHLNKRIGKKGNWMTLPPDHISTLFQFEGFDDINDVVHYTAKTRQSAWVDLDMTFDSAAGIGALHASEGLNCQAEIVAAFNRRYEVNTLFIFDEIDGNLDFRSKQLFFGRVVPALHGTVIVVTHDPLFIQDCDVFDFTTKTSKPFPEYVKENMIKLA